MFIPGQATHGRRVQTQSRRSGDEPVDHRCQHLALEVTEGRVWAKVQVHIDRSHRPCPRRQAPHDFFGTADSGHGPYGAPLPPPSGSGAENCAAGGDLLRHAAGPRGHPGNDSIRRHHSLEKPPRQMALRQHSGGKCLAPQALHEGNPRRSAGQRQLQSDCVSRCSGKTPGFPYHLDRETIAPELN